jgi:hypothetical protein
LVNNSSTISDVVRALTEKQYTLKENLKDKYKNPWTLSKIEEELVLHLSSYIDSEKASDEDENEIIIILHPYQITAQHYLYRINISDPLPFFEIHDSLLYPKLRQELFDLKGNNPNEFNKVITNAVRRLYESINYDYFHTSGISGKICWRIVS